MHPSGATIVLKRRYFSCAFFFNRHFRSVQYILVSIEAGWQPSLAVSSSTSVDPMREEIRPKTAHTRWHENCERVVLSGWLLLTRMPDIVRAFEDAHGVGFLWLSVLLDCFTGFTSTCETFMTISKEATAWWRRYVKVTNDLTGSAFDNS